MEWHYLHSLIEPASVAVFGASERPDAVGRFVFQTFLDGGFAGPVHPINAKYAQVLGRPRAASIGEIEEDVERGVRAAIVLSIGLTPEGGAR